MIKDQDLNTLRKIRDISDLRYGACSLYLYPANNRVYFKLSFKTSNLKTIEEKVFELEKRVSNRFQHLLPISNYKKTTTSHFCSTSYQLDIFIITPPHDLLQEIQLRSSQNRPFRTSEMTRLFYHVVHGMAHLQKLGFIHCCFGPEFIALFIKKRSSVTFPQDHIQREEGLETRFQAMVIEDPRVMSYSQKDAYNNNKRLYLSPQAYRAYQKQSKNKKSENNFGNISSGQFDEKKANIFSVGLVILEAGLCQSVQAVYRAGGVFDVHILETMIILFGRVYGKNKVLVEVVERMLSIQEYDRPDFVEILERIPEYENMDWYNKPYGGDSTGKTRYRHEFDGGGDNDGEKEGQKALDISQSYKSTLSYDNEQYQYQQQPISIEKVKLKSERNERNFDPKVEDSSSGTMEERENMDFDNFNHARITINRLETHENNNNSDNSSKGRSKNEINFGDTGVSFRGVREVGDGGDIKRRRKPFKDIKNQINENSSPTSKLAKNRPENEFREVFREQEQYQNIIIRRPKFTKKMSKNQLHSTTNIDIETHNTLKIKTQTKRSRSKNLKMKTSKNTHHQKTKKRSRPPSQSPSPTRNTRRIFKLENPQNPYHKYYLNMKGDRSHSPPTSQQHPIPYQTRDNSHTSYIRFQNTEESRNTGYQISPSTIEQVTSTQECLVPEYDNSLLQNNKYQYQKSAFKQQDGLKFKDLNIQESSGITDEEGIDQWSCTDVPYDIDDYQYLL